jgi:hypothetical protein
MDGVPDLWFSSIRKVIALVALRKTGSPAASYRSRIESLPRLSSGKCLSMREGSSRSTRRRNPWSIRRRHATWLISFQRYRISAMKWCRRPHSGHYFGHRKQMDCEISTPHRPSLLASDETLVERWLPRGRLQETRGPVATPRIAGVAQVCLMSRLSGRKEDGRSWLVEWRTGDRLWKQGSYDGCAFRATRNQQLSASGPEAGRGPKMRSYRNTELFVSVSTRRSSR